MKGYAEVNVSSLREFCVDVFRNLGVPDEDASITADVLIVADQRGIGSHGVQRLRRYVVGLRSGYIKPTANIMIIKETANTLLLSGGQGLGQVIGYRAMRAVIDKAVKNNVALALVRDSNHYGIAGYYPMMALEYGLIGISLSNTTPGVTPTFSRERILGTNPIAVAVPAGKEKPFVLDMATSTAPFGKIEIYHREGKKIPLTWATDAEGNATDDPSSVLQNMSQLNYGGLLPLGGASEENGGHKGYGLALLVDILCGVLAGGLFGPNLYRATVKGEPSTKLSQLFAAIRIDAFIDPAVFKNAMDEYIRILKNSEKAIGQKRVYIHGEKEFEKYQKQKIKVLILNKVLEELRETGDEMGIRGNF